MDIKFLYKVESYCPKGNTFGSFGFSVKLDYDFAKKALENEISERTYNDLRKIGNMTIENIDLTSFDSFSGRPYHFVTNNDGKSTNLVQWFQVPGNSCDLGLDWSQINYLKEEEKYRNYIEYMSHNIDSPKQAYALLSNFTSWVDLTSAIIK